MMNGSMGRRLAALEAQVPPPSAATEEEQREKAWASLVNIFEKAEALGKRIATEPRERPARLDHESSMSLLARLLVPTEAVPEELAQAALERRVVWHEERGDTHAAGLVRVVLAVWKQVIKPAAEGEDRHE